MYGILNCSDAKNINEMGPGSGYTVDALTVHAQMHVRGGPVCTCIHVHVLPCV